MPLEMLKDDATVGMAVAFEVFATAGVQGVPRALSYFAHNPSCPPTLMKPEQ